MKVSELQNADIAGIEKSYSHWERAISLLKDAESGVAGPITGKIRSGAWQGLSGVTAATTADSMRQNLATGETEATSVKWLLWRAAGYFRPAKERLNQLVAGVRANPKLRLEEDGRVWPAPPTAAETVSGTGAHHEYIQLVDQANQYTTAIRKILSEATEADKKIADALRKAADTAGIGSPRMFNTDAPTDGALDLSEIPGQRLGWYYTLLDQIGAGNIGGGTPKEQSARIGEMAQRHAERGGGQCRVVEGMMTCVGVPPHMYARGGTTYGDTFISPYASFEELETGYSTTRATRITNRGCCSTRSVTGTDSGGSTARTSVACT
ncbi:hypothetical protein LX16_1852 [Stackebrandtia albiflava]|uniref:PPE family protein n=1 Tax=Stackebrandtia albiflava TaxID=406432 RepID=A0A562VE34_9ACTN|nr:hypothetical protein [Stackebrandtia albiflava]TWJ16128.1 hypothetical protein LX16_1852 [Stackebrandtia albiflava]